MKSISDKLLLGFKVRLLRQKAGLSFVALSQQTGLSVSYLNEIEKGKKFPRPEKLRTLAKGLNTTVQWLISPDPGPHLAPVAALLRSNFLNELPLDLFGIDAGKILEVLTVAPDQVNAFVSSLVELAQNHAVGANHFYLSAMRAYQEMHNNYFPELEEHAKKARIELNLQGTTLTIHQLEACLIQHFQVKVIHHGLDDYPELHHLRSVYIEHKKELWINSGLSEHQLRFQLCKEIGFQFLNLNPRPNASALLDIHSFQQVLHNFKAGYFAVALLIDADAFLKVITEAFSGERFDHRIMLTWLDQYQVGPDVLFQRFNVIPGKWGIDNVFFLRLTNLNGQLMLDKELHLHRVERRYASRLNESYCRRWLACQLMEQLAHVPEMKRLTGMVKVRYHDSDLVWLCLGMAGSTSTEHSTGLMIGVLLNQETLDRFPCAMDPHIPLVTIGLTCERCEVEDCKERQSPPLVLEQQKARQAVRKTLRKITE